MATGRGSTRSTAATEREPEVAHRQDSGHKGSLLDEQREAESRARAAQATTRPAVQAGGRHIAGRTRTATPSAIGAPPPPRLHEGRGASQPVSRAARPPREKSGSSSTQTGTRGGGQRNRG